MPALRIGVNALYLIPGEVGGTEIYLKSLLGALAEIDSVNDYLIYANAESRNDFVFPSSRFQVVHCNVRASFRPGRIAWEQTMLPLLLHRHRIDVLFNPGFTAPIFFGPSITVFHDLQHKRHPEFFRLFDLPFWLLMLWLSVVRSRRLIAVSQATADDISRYYPRAAHKTAVIPHGVDPEFFRIAVRRKNRPETTAGSRFLLVVSTLHPHKNLQRLLEAFSHFRAQHPGFRLVVAGLKGFAARKLEDVQRELGLGDSVTFTGWIPRDDLYELFERAFAYVAPSEFEGFGMPVVEAMAAGIPVACSNIAPFLEISGAAAVLFDPSSVADISRAITLITTDSEWRRNAAIAGPRQARLFDWGQAAALTLRELEQAAEAA